MDITVFPNIAYVLGEIIPNITYNITQYYMNHTILPNITVACIMILGNIQYNIT